MLVASLKRNTQIQHGILNHLNLFHYTPIIFPTKFPPTPRTIIHKIRLTWFFNNPINNFSANYFLDSEAIVRNKNIKNKQNLFHRRKRGFRITTKPEENYIDKIDKRFLLYSSEEN